MRLAHIVNPFKADPDSDLYLAQPLTFESMIRAKDQAKDELEVELLSAQFSEDREVAPNEFKKTSDLSSSVLDQKKFNKQLKLPLIYQILDRLYEESDAEFLIYTNVDIGLYPNFYLEVKKYLNQGHDALIINRRRLSHKFLSANNLDQIYQERGKSHPGFDCFVFHRSLYPHFRLAKVCIGVPFIGITLAQNVFALAKNYHLVEHEKLSFHLGEELFARRAPREYFYFNRSEFWKAMNSDLSEKLDLKKFPYYESHFWKRWIKWALQPSIPIRLALKLAFRNWLK